MMKQVIWTLLCLLTIASCEHLILGDVNGNKQLIHQTKVEYGDMPFKKRVKNVFYNGYTKINSIMAYDNLHTKATATITAGGVGYTYANIRLKSERGKALDYDVTIYA